MKKTKIVSCTKREAEVTFELWKLKNKDTLQRIYNRGCERCGLKREESKFPNVLQIHHLNGDKRENFMYNLQCLCSNCHRDFHQKTFSVRYKYPSY